MKNLQCDLDLEINLIFTQNIPVMMIYHPIKFGCRKISSSVDMVETVISDYMSPHCDLELEDSKPIFLHDTPDHDDTPPYQVWL